MNVCIFCDIVAGKIPSYKIWEDEKHLAFLDIFPICDGQTLVVSKEHLDSYVFNLDDQQYSDLYLAAKKTAKLLDKALSMERCVQVMEGLGVKHAHIKLFPLNSQKLAEGGIVHLGPKAEDVKLKQLVTKIKGRGDDL